LHDSCKKFALTLAGIIPKELLSHVQCCAKNRVAVSQKLKYHRDLLAIFENKEQNQRPNPAAMRHYHFDA
jgi:hypothetical protein